MIWKTGLWITTMIVFASLALAVTQDPTPQEPGQVILNRACTVCHTLAEVTKFKGFYSRDQWADIVRTMRADGASLQDSEVTPLVDFLFKTYGKVEPPAVDGKKLLESSCAGCHDLDTAVGVKRNKDGWEEVVGRMIGRGASVSDAEFPILVEYLTKNYGSQ